MINYANMVNKLIEKINQIPDDIIIDAIKEVIKEDRKEYFGDLFKAIPKYDTKEKYYYDNKYDLYIHMNSTSHYGIKEALYTDKEEEVMVA